jgi:hypothetical protein
MNNDKPDTRAEKGTWYCCYKYQTKTKAECLRKAKPALNMVGILLRNVDFLITAKQPLVVFSKPVAQVDNSRTNCFGH